MSHFKIENLSTNFAIANSINIAAREGFLSGKLGIA